MNIANFDLNLLRVFDALMTELNVTRAAQRVFLSQPATSHALARLRRELNDPLFVRAGRAMIPTPKATELRPAVRAILDQVALVLGDNEFDPRTAAAVFRIGSLDLTEYIMAPMLAKMIKEEAPHVQFLIQAYDDSDFQARLASGALDFVVGINRPLGPGIHARKLGGHRIVGVVRKGHPLTRGRVTSRRFMEVPRLAVEFRADRVDGPIDRLLGSGGGAGKVVYATPHYFAAPHLLASTDLLLITGDVPAILLCADFPLWIVEIPVRLPLLEPHIIWHERAHRDPAQQWMRSKIVELADQVHNEILKKR